GEQHLLPAAAEGVRGRVGRADAAGVPVRGQGEPLSDARQAADRSPRRDRALLRTDRAARAILEARPRLVAVAGELPPERRPARGCTGRVSARPALPRVPSRELVRGTGV